MLARKFTSIVAGVAVALGSCAYVEHQGPPTCSDDVTLCPTSSKTATAVSCECTCTVGMIAGERTLRGKVKACLPAALNAAIASPEQQIALDAMDPREYDQRVFRYCHESVAGFVQGIVRTQGKSFIACGVPLTCECSTGGAFLDTWACRSPCLDVSCSERTCPNILYTTVLDMGWCSCSRAEACAGSFPGPDEPPLCLSSNLKQ
ncbi:MAG: hypothetical protein KF819_35775 [Labilithrix sp.]|nr:hypothetical protein [Labilithrix sp.]